ncbi:hypothetical protein [Algoriphagus sp.]|uniref:hypothetical protein n=1 Tax=Algoriphagus sp. TaxID=1872435 RepID=UPI00391CF1DC
MYKTIFLILISTSVLKAQVNEPIEVEEEKSKAGITRQFTPSVGFVQSGFRDFATSPLYYQGPGLHLGLGWYWEGAKWENGFEANLNLAFTQSKAPNSEYFQTGHSAVFINSQIYNSYLRKIDNWSFRDYTFKVGGTFISDFNTRINTSLQNATGGFEALANLMLAGKVEKDISRTQSKEFGFWFLKRTLNPAKRKLSFQLNAGLLNFNWRPGYSYVLDSEINGSDSKLTEYFFASHSWSLNGWRLGSRLEYSVIRPSGNGMKFSYVWDAAHAPGKFENFQMASHSIRYTLIVNSSKK